MKAHETGIGSALLVSAFMDAHPFTVKVLTAVALAIVSTITSQLIQRFFRREK